MSHWMMQVGKSVILGGRPKSSVTFAHIAREERAALINLFKQKDIAMKGLREEQQNFDAALGSESDEELPQERGDRPAPKKREQPEGGGDDDEESPDSDFGGQSSSSDDLEYASKASSESDSGEDENSGESDKKKKKKQKLEGDGKDKEEEDDE
jgi:hypothetical protein